jgi:hypothetical protein
VDGPGVRLEFRRIRFEVDELFASVGASGLPHPELAARPWR